MTAVMALRRRPSTSGVWTESAGEAAAVCVRESETVIHRSRVVDAPARCHRCARSSDGAFGCSPIWVANVLAGHGIR